MHMTDALISPAVGITMCVVSTAAVAYAVKKNVSEKKIPMMGVMGAFIFAAQMIDVAIPGTGSSGHITGGILLAAMIGATPALLSMSAVLIIQCLFFGDGGLLALGCNIFNLGVIPCLIVYPLVFEPLIKKNANPSKITIASIFAVVAGLQLGAFGVVLQTHISGVAELPFSAFAILMQSIHLIIGVAEGIVTAAILCFVLKMRPEVMECISSRETVKHHSKGVIIAFAAIALLGGCVLSQFASSNPDGLEWSIERANVFEK
ncbi:MAG: energy-coupling factor ABC transporter permease [Fibromonadaceae bacterium]|jgi:cobalt/nickel transport system permease protein|nr:energy-coupling factor ABC transporter permease [Fibromonadaceae bacterium]